MHAIASAGCPNCGAPRTSDVSARACPYCGVHVLTAQRSDETKLPDIDDRILLSARRCLLASGYRDFYFHPHIPQRKLQTVLETHGKHITKEESIPMLFDATVFGSAEEGMVVSRAGLLYKNRFEEPGCIEWSRIRPDTVHDDGEDLFVDRVRIAEARGDTIGECDLVSGLLAIAECMRSGNSDPVKVADAFRQYIRRYSVFEFHPGLIPEHELEEREVHCKGVEGLQPDERILVCLWDRILLGGGVALSVTRRGVWWRWGLAAPRLFDISQLTPNNVRVETRASHDHKSTYSTVSICGTELGVSNGRDWAEMFAGFLGQLSSQCSD